MEAFLRVYAILHPPLRLRTRTLPGGGAGTSNTGSGTVYIEQPSDSTVSSETEEAFDGTSAGDTAGGGACTRVTLTFARVLTSTVFVKL